MLLEIERKFLVKNEDYKKDAVKKLYRQGYLSTGKDCTIRIRIVDDSAMLTIKGPAVGLARPEYEYPIPVEDADGLLKLCQRPIIEKYRYKAVFEDKVWEIDEFLGDNAGLTIAEIELDFEDQAFVTPDWLGPEVTSDPRYYNSNLTLHPYKEWKATH